MSCIRIRGGGRTCPHCYSNVEAHKQWCDVVQIRWLRSCIDNVGRGHRERQRSLEYAERLKAMATTRQQHKEAEKRVKGAKHLIKWCAAAREVAYLISPDSVQRARRITAAVKARDALSGVYEEGYSKEAYEVAAEHAEEVMTREIGMPGPFLDSCEDGPGPWADAHLDL